MMDTWSAGAAFGAFQVVVLGYFFALNSIYLLAAVTAFGELRRYSRRLKTVHVGDQWTTSVSPGVTVIVPAFNEEAGSVDSIRALLQLHYPDFEILFVNDGSTDRTFERVADHFELVPVDRYPTADLPTARIRGVYRSRRYPRLWLIDKENGGRSDALNAALSYCRTPILCRIDADSILERDALTRIVRPFLEDHTTVGAGGIVRIVNGSTVEDGVVTAVELPRSLLARLQIVEYLRAFLTARVGWNRLGGTHIVSGAFSAWRRSILVEVGGFDVRTVGEDMELTIRLHRYCREKKIPYQISFIPDPVVWTEAPERLRDLGRQRERWQRGLLELLRTHRRMLFNRRYGRVGLVVVPYLYVLEALGPIVETLGYISLVYIVLTGAVGQTWFVAYLLLALTFGVAISAAAVALEELVFRRYHRARDLLALFGLAVVENLGYRQVIMFWRAWGTLRHLTGRRRSEGNLRKSGFKSSPGRMGPPALAGASPQHDA